MVHGTMPDKVVLSEDEMAPAIDKLFKRLNVHESVAIQDNQPRSLMAGDESLPDAITRMKKEIHIMELRCGATSPPVSCHAAR